MPEFHLSLSGADGVSCDASGAFVGPVPLLDRLQKDDKDAWHPRECEELSEQISGLYGLPIDMSSKTGGLKAIANALNKGDVTRAQIAAVLLGIPHIVPLSKGARSRDRMIKLVRDLAWSGMLKWDSDEHPRWPAGTPDDKGGKKGGKFAPKGEGNGMGASSAPPSDARGAAHTTTRRGLGTSPPQTKPIDTKQESFWQALGSRLSHEAKSALRQIGQMQVAESENDFAAASAGANAVGQDLRAYAEYRRQLWLDSHGQPFQVPAIEADDPLSERAGLMGHFLFEPKAPLMRPAVNAGWIDPLINLASLGAMGAGIPFRFAGPIAEAIGGAGIAALSGNTAEDASILDQLSAAASRAAAKVGPGSGRFHGTAVHSSFRVEVDALGNANISTEQSYLNGRVVPYGTRGSVRVDVVEGPLDSPTAAYDLKTGKAPLTQSRIEQVRSHLPAGAERIPFHEMRP
ncbi:MAG TPA: hypothetical protein VMD53_05250 [Rhizomicrobium sp.]|nr:hypothetical protein [Rhizomicrobium sp.]